MEIYKAMSAIMADTAAIAKDRRNKEQGFQYRGIDDLYNTLHGVFAKYKVFSTCEVLSMERTVAPNAKGTLWVSAVYKFKFTFHAIDGTFVSTETVGEGRDTADKASNKAMSVAHKYALLTTFLVPTEDMMDDPDASSPIIETYAQGTDQFTALSTPIKSADMGTLVALYTEYNGVYGKTTNLWPKLEASFKARKAELQQGIA